MDFKYDVFISYSRKDTAVADEITRAFEKEGISYFIDRKGIRGGMEFPMVLAKAIRESKVFLFLASENSYVSKFTQNEIVYAFNKKQKQDIIPYIIDGSELPEELEFTFSAINWRVIEQHPIETVLVDDILYRLGRERKPEPPKVVEVPPIKVEEKPIEEQKPSVVIEEKPVKEQKPSESVKASTKKEPPKPVKEQKPFVVVEEKPIEEQKPSLVVEEKPAIEQKPSEPAKEPTKKEPPKSVKEQPVVVEVPPVATKEPETVAPSTEWEEEEAPSFFQQLSDRVLNIGGLQLTWKHGVGALVVLAALVFFLTRGGEDANTGSPSEVETTDVTQTAPQTAQDVKGNITGIGNYVYNGEVDENGMPHGQGEATFENGNFYKGPFNHGVLEGENVFYKLGQGDTFEGSFADNHYKEGKYTIQSTGEYFVGTYKDGNPEHGVWYDKSGKELERQ